MDGLEELLPLQGDTSTNCIRLAHLLLLLRPRFVGELGTHRGQGAVRGLWGHSGTHRGQGAGLGALGGSVLLSPPSIPVLRHPHHSERFGGGGDKGLQRRNGSAGQLQALDLRIPKSSRGKMDQPLDVNIPRNSRGNGSSLQLQPLDVNIPRSSRGKMDQP